MSTIGLRRRRRRPKSTFTAADDLRRMLRRLLCISSSQEMRRLVVNDAFVVRWIEVGRASGVRRIWSAKVGRPRAGVAYVR